VDEDAVICDFAETYHILDYTALPVETAATLAAGLRDDSRIMMKLAKLRVKPELFALCTIADRLGLLVWMQTKDGQKNRNRPASMLEAISEEQKKDEKPIAYHSGAEFMAAWNRITAKKRR